MAKAAVYSNDNEQVGEIELRDDIFNVPIKADILHEVVKAQLARRRAFGASTKGRSEVRGGGSKPWRQKGTGRARAGSRNSPLWRGGGVIFGPKPRNYAPKVNKRIRKQALKMALSSKCNGGQLVVLDDPGLTEIKTKAFVAIMGAFGIDNVLVVSPEPDEILEKSARNVPHTKVLCSEGLNVYDVLKYRHLMLIKNAVPKIEAALGRTATGGS